MISKIAYISQKIAQANSRNEIMHTIIIMIICKIKNVRVIIMIIL